MDGGRARLMKLGRGVGPKIKKLCVLIDGKFDGLSDKHSLHLWENCFSFQRPNSLVNSIYLNHLQSACNREITYNCFVLTPVCSIRIAKGGGIEIEVYFPTLAIIHTYCPFTCFPHSLEARFRLYPAARVAPRRRLPQLVVGK